MKDAIRDQKDAITANLECKIHYGSYTETLIYSCKTEARTAVEKSRAQARHWLESLQMLALLCKVTSISVRVDRHT